MTQHPTHPVVRYIQRAQQLGSKATSLKGAGAFILSRTVSIFPRQFTSTMYRRLTKEEWHSRSHRERLVARYVGLQRLPRYLSAADRQVIADSPLSQQLQRLRALPAYVRAFSMSPLIRSVPRLARFVTEADTKKGVLADWSAIATNAFRRMDWGRLQKRYLGESCLTPGLRTETNNKWGWNQVSWHYADYTFILPRPEHRRPYFTAHYVSPDLVTHRVFVSPSFLRIDNEQPVRRQETAQDFSRIPVHSQRRLLALHTPAVLKIEYDREAKSLMLVDGYGEQYHLRPIARSTDAECLVREAITAFRKRREEKVALFKQLSDAQGVWVSVEDSLQAGNCRPETERFSALLHEQLGAPGALGAVRGDVILGLRNDNYTRRAVAYASCRHQQIAA